MEKAPSQNPSPYPSLRGAEAEKACQEGRKGRGNERLASEDPYQIPKSGVTKKMKKYQIYD